MTRPSSIPVSAPTSPAVTRSKTDRHPPVTPQRATQSVQYRHVSSPYTPATTLSTPYTPFSLRSLSSSSNGSNLATPASVAGRRRLSLSLSPEVNMDSTSFADIAENWRMRANENGIKVTSGDDSQYLADESSLDISIPIIDKALLPAPFLSTQRRARAFTHTQVPFAQIPDPTQLATPNRSFRAPSVINTPPPQPGFRLRGSVTDPAHTRRRPAFGQVTELFDISEDEYDPYPPAFSTLPSQSLPLALTDPFNLSSDLSMAQEPDQFYETSMHAVGSAQKLEKIVFACSVCGTSGGALAILEPCLHPLCSACLTSALNIVGEKDMECAVCKAKVDNFQLHKTNPWSAEGKRLAREMSGVQERAYSDAEYAAHDEGLLPSAFDGGPGKDLGGVESFDDFMDRAQGASTPVAGRRAQRHSELGSARRVVLRVDNVPWDITPPAIAAWLKHPVERVHVLLDRKGKTLSHAYVEVANAEIAKAALRSAQNSVLGRGKRARGVTVTKSSQEELMRALFPSWQGNFEGSRPSLSGLDNERVISTLQRGLLSEVELNSLLHLIRSPDSHFLKVPSLPFHSLISILSKFPADDDSRVFWSSTLRDLLYDITHAALQVLLARNEENTLSDWTSLTTQVVRAAMDCQAFTAEQMGKLSDILEASFPTSSPSGSSSTSLSPPPLQPKMEEMHQSHTSGRPSPSGEAFNELAHEFGVQPQLIEALARRLSGIPPADVRLKTYESQDITGTQLLASTLDMWTAGSREKR
ncbi:uncharacterized protein FIBRA_08100 [Fibroporia radiculosa]|uniref:RING-type domain-containing protein n=1 Tax=Fibroporia radiculosa TaxID=599839 RepID=J4H4Z8_9APHY|nr:uncharacterized protein FIBRA_08100 [Fibroporia radiculosa]CCM05864.1 predicted protein [Fibroporia radiculosa]